MNPSDGDKLTALENLVDELLKPSPKESVIDNCMHAAGLDKSKDPIERINRVLSALQFETPIQEIEE